MKVSTMKKVEARVFSLHLLTLIWFIRALLSFVKSSHEMSNICSRLLLLCYLSKYEVTIVYLP